MFTPIVKHDKDKVTGEYANKYPPTFKAKIPYNSSENKFDFDCYDMDNNEINFNDILSNLKGGKAQFIIQLSGIWFSAGIFGCSWKIVSSKFQQINMSKPTFVPDSDDELNNGGDDEDDDDISVDNDIVAKITQKQQVVDKKVVVEKPVVVAKSAQKVVVPSEDEDDDEDDDEDEEEDENENDKELANVDEEDEEEEEDVVVPVKVEEPPVKVVSEKAKKTVVKKAGK
jgi:hypothetical protein